jgi:hypothetical protein
LFCLEAIDRIHAGRLEAAPGGLRWAAVGCGGGHGGKWQKIVEFCHFLIDVCGQTPKTPLKRPIFARNTLAMILYCLAIKTPHRAAQSEIELHTPFLLSRHGAKQFFQIIAIDPAGAAEPHRMFRFFTFQGAGCVPVRLTAI